MANRPWNMIAPSPPAPISADTAARPTACTAVTRKPDSSTGAASGSWMRQNDWRCGHAHAAGGVDDLRRNAVQPLHRVADHRQQRIQHQARSPPARGRSPLMPTEPSAGNAAARPESGPISSPNSAIDGMVWMMFSTGNTPRRRPARRWAATPSGKPISTVGIRAAATMTMCRSRACENWSRWEAYSRSKDRSPSTPLASSAASGPSTITAGEQGPLSRQAKPAAWCQRPSAAPPRPAPRTPRRARFAPRRNWTTPPTRSHRSRPATPPRRPWQPAPRRPTQRDVACPGRSSGTTRTSAAASERPRSGADPRGKPRGPVRSARRSAAGSARGTRRRALPARPRPAAGAAPGRAARRRAGDPRRRVLCDEAPCCAASRSATFVTSSPSTEIFALSLRSVSPSRAAKAGASRAGIFG